MFAANLNAQFQRIGQDKHLGHEVRCTLLFSHSRISYLLSALTFSRLVEYFEYSVRQTVHV